MEKNEVISFNDAYLERADKMTDEVIAKETVEFVKQPISYFKNHKNEFLYVESKAFESIRVEAVSFEVDDVFGTYDVMLGLKLPKKQASAIRDEVKKQLVNENSSFDLMFNGEDGLWDFNFSLNDVKGFNEELTIGDAYHLIYNFLFNIVDAVSGANQS